MNLFYAFLSSFSLAFAILNSSLYGWCDFDREVADICHPTFEEYRKIQKCLSLMAKEDLPPTGSNRLEVTFGSMKLVGDHPDEVPVYESVFLNGDSTNKKNCIVMYVTYNSPYPQNLMRTLNALKEVGFDGHVLYWIGGYPNVEQGDLKKVDVPYAFKSCAIQAAANLGYQNILWLDSSLLPIRDLSSLFTTLEQSGYLLIASGTTIQDELKRKFINQPAFAAMRLTKRESYLVPHIHASFYGLNVGSASGAEVLRRLRHLAEEKNPTFYCDWVDEAVMSVILYRMGLNPSGRWDQYLIKEGEAGTGEPYFKMSIARPAGR